MKVIFLVLKILNVNNSNHDKCNLLWVLKRMRQVSKKSKYTKSYSEIFQASLIELFPKIISGYKTSTIFWKISILNVWQGCEHAFETENIITICSKPQKSNGIELSSNLEFHSHIENLSENKWNAFLRLTNYMELTKKKYSIECTF